MLAAFDSIENLCKQDVGSINSSASLLKSHTVLKPFVIKSALNKGSLFSKVNPVLRNIGVFTSTNGNIYNDHLCVFVGFAVNSHLTIQLNHI